MAVTGGGICKSWQCIVLSLQTLRILESAARHSTGSMVNVKAGFLF